MMSSIETCTELQIPNIESRIHAEKSFWLESDIKVTFHDLMKLCASMPLEWFNVCSKSIIDLALVLHP